MSSEPVMWPLALIGTLSLAVIALTISTVHLIRLERRRSDARVAALAAAIDDPRWQARFDDSEHAESLVPPPPAVSLVVPDVERPSRAPAFAIAALVVLGAGTLLFAGLNGQSRGPRHVAAAIAPSIELVAMRHALDGETLIVSGLVRNSGTAATPSLSAVISVLGRDGRVVARSESKLDASVLGPGKETTFRVAVPEVEDPGRYRLAFMDDGHIVPHVDRRGNLSRTALVNEAHGN